MTFEQLVLNFWHVNSWLFNSWLLNSWLFNSWNVNSWFLTVDFWTVGFLTVDFRTVGFLNSWVLNSRPSFSFICSNWKKRRKLLKPICLFSWICVIDESNKTVPLLIMMMMNSEKFHLNIISWLLIWAFVFEKDELSKEKEKRRKLS